MPCPTRRFVAGCGRLEGAAVKMPVTAQQHTTGRARPFCRRSQAIGRKDGGSIRLCIAAFSDRRAGPCPAYCECPFGVWSTYASHRSLEMRCGKRPAARHCALQTDAWRESHRAAPSFSAKACAKRALFFAGQSCRPICCGVAGCDLSVLSPHAPPRAKPPHSSNGPDRRGLCVGAITQPRALKQSIPMRIGR